MTGLRASGIPFGQHWKTNIVYIGIVRLPKPESLTIPLKT